MKRYATTPKKIDKSGIRVYGTTYYPEILISDMDTFIYPVEGERLDSLAHKSYGDASLWWVIAQFNQLPTEGHVKLGNILYVPLPLERILQYMDI